MKQSVMLAPGKVEFNDIDKPTPGPNEVLMQTLRIGVCGSDIHVYHGQHPFVNNYPIVQGHEVGGIVAEVGEGVTKVKVGDKITFAPQVICGECYPCRHGMYNICESLKVHGFQTDGAGQEYFALPEWNVFKLPDDMSLDFAAMVEPLAVAVHAVRRDGDVAGKKVLVLGGGTIGNLVAQAAGGLGAAAVMITDVSAYKLEKAKACGITYAVNPAAEDLNAAILRDFGPDRADLILECVGAQATATQAIANARKGSTIVIVGVFGKKPEVDLGLVQDRELNIKGSLMYVEEDYEIAIDLISSGKMHLDKMITHRFNFDDYLDAYHAIEESKGEYLKVMIELE